MKNIIKWIIAILFLLPALIFTITTGFIILFLFLIFGLPAVIIGGLQRKYVKNNLMGIDQLGNCIMAGDPDESISSRAGRRWPNSWWSKFINLLFWWQDNHVVNAIEKDEGKKDLI